MNSQLLDYLSYAIGIGAIIGLFRIRHIEQVYFPFILLLWVGLVNEILSTVLIQLIHNNAINSNIYVLAESLLILWFFEKLGLFKKNKYIFWVFFLLFLFGWIAENLILFSIRRFNPYFRIGYSFTIVLLSIHMINHLLANEHKRLLKNPVFLIMLGFIGFFTYKALIEIFWMYGLNSSKDFRVQVYRLMTFINLFVNLLFALAVLWIPRKREYILP